MRLAPLLLGLLFVGSASAAEPASWLAEWFSPELRRLEQQRVQLEQELTNLGAPVVGQTVEQFGYQHTRLAAAPLNPAWVQIDLGSPQTLDWIALVPAQLDWQSIDRPAYGFPKRFRIDLSDDPAFQRFITVADFTESDFPEPAVSPVSVQVSGVKARYLRVTVTKFAIENEQHFFALGEIMALSGNRNVAIGRPVTVSGRYELKPRWSQQNLVDGRTPLGPPIRKELLGYDGVFVDTPEDGATPFMQVTLDRVVTLQEVRLHPVHARIGADVPGFAFPLSFRVEAAADDTFTNPILLFESNEFDNPGNNPVTIPASGISAKAVRVLFFSGRPLPNRRYGLSEVEIYADGVNVARQGAVVASEDYSNFSRGWPRSSLIDGFTSYGRLMELPEWLSSWNHRRALQLGLGMLAQQRTSVLEHSVNRGFRVVGGVVAMIAGVSILLAWRGRLRRQRELEQLRLRLARDLHDEIGSNLAGISMLSEMGEENSVSSEAREDWREVNRITRESVDAMREVLWVLGARQEAGIELIPQLQRASTRMLRRQQVTWREIPETLPAGFPMEARRQLFLFFKEALANIAHHAEAQQVTLALRAEPEEVVLEIEDDGRGFDPATVRRGTGLASLTERARLLKARLVLDAAPNQGAKIRLHVPV